MSHFLKHIREALARACNADREIFQGLSLPPARQRFNHPGLRDNAAFLASAEVQVQKLVKECRLGTDSSVLDFGSGQGRFAIGLLRRFPELRRYEGVDTHEKSVDWCRRHIEVRQPRFHFTYLPAQHPRYNPEAKGLRLLPFPGHTFDVAFLNSVFSHLSPPDVRFYLEELHRVLKPGGFLYFTAFIEEGVPLYQENPAEYFTARERAGGAKTRAGPLLCALYEKSYLLSLVENSGFSLISVDYHSQESALDKELGRPFSQSAVVCRASPW